MNARETLFFLVSVICPLASFAFSLQADKVAAFYDNPSGQAARAYVPFLDGHKPVHQDLTDASLECGKTHGACARLTAMGITRGSVHEGVRWNDFPAVYLNRDSAPWCMDRVLRITNDGDIGCIIGSIVRAATQKSRFSDRVWTRARPISMRGHFGDLQFWHSMAPEGEPAEKTFQRIRTWMQFAYLASLGKFDLKSDIHDVPVEGIRELFVRGSRRVGDLLDYRYDKDKMLARGIALGQMLHIAQDSFAGCHVMRDSDGRIVQFLSYAKQSTKAHGHFDEDEDKIKAAISGRLNPVEFGRRLLHLRADGAEWSKVSDLVDEYFKPINGHALAIPGDHCK